MENDVILHVIDQIKFSRVPLWIKHASKKLEIHPENYEIRIRRRLLESSPYFKKSIEQLTQ